MNKKDRIARNLMRRKWYQPDWERPNVRWKIVERERVGDVVVILTHQGDDYAVFTDLLIPKSYPTDKFFQNYRDGMKSYKEILKGEQEVWDILQESRTMKKEKTVVS